MRASGGRAGGRASRRASVRASELADCCTSTSTSRATSIQDVNYEPTFRLQTRKRERARRRSACARAFLLLDGGCSLRVVSTTATTTTMSIGTRSFVLRGKSTFGQLSVLRGTISAQRRLHSFLIRVTTPTKTAAARAQCSYKSCDQKQHAGEKRNAQRNKTRFAAHRLAIELFGLAIVDCKGRLQLALSLCQFLSINSLYSNAIESSRVSVTKTNLARRQICLLKIEFVAAADE